MKKQVKTAVAEEEVAAKPAVIFDFDGTLMDTDVADIVSYRAMFEKYKRSKLFTPEVEEEVVNISVEKVIEKYFSDKKKKNLVREFAEYQNKHLIDLIQPLHGVSRVLKWLKGNGYPLAVISYRSQKNLTLMLATRELTEDFDAIVGTRKGDVESELKPEDIIRVCEFLKTDHAIYISSNANNIQAAKAAGAYTVSYIANSSHTGRLIDAQADFNIADMGQIAKLVSGEPYWLAYDLVR